MSHKHIITINQWRIINQSKHMGKYRVILEIPPFVFHFLFQRSSQLAKHTAKIVLVSFHICSFLCVWDASSSEVHLILVIITSYKSPIFATATTFALLLLDFCFHLFQLVFCPSSSHFAFLLFVISDYCHFLISIVSGLYLRMSQESSSLTQ